MPTMTLPKIDAEKLYERADAFQTRMLKSAESYATAAVKRIPTSSFMYADRMPNLEVVTAEFFNRATKIQSANRVFVKRVFLSEEAAAPKAAAPKAASKTSKTAAK